MDLEWFYILPGIGGGTGFFRPHVALSSFQPQGIHAARMGDARCVGAAARLPSLDIRDRGLLDADLGGQLSLFQAGVLTRGLDAMFEFHLLIFTGTPICLQTGIPFF